MANLPQLSPELITVVVLFSVLTLLASVAIVPWVLTRIPADYFKSSSPPESKFKSSHPVASLAIIVARNLLGVVLCVLGILMLVLPGQGILTLVVASFLLQFPGKYKIQRWLVRRPGVSKSINWLREKFDKPPLQLDD